MGAQTVCGRLRIAAAAVLILALSLLGVILSGCDEDDIEKMLGSTTASSIEGAYGVNRDPLLANWLEDMGQTMVSFSTRQQIPYSFRILETDMVNALAGPWGHIYVTEGLLDFADSDEQIAGVVGHEIGHVVNRDIMKSFKKNILFGVGVSVIDRKSDTAGTIAGIGIGLLSLRYSRKAEYAADDSGRMLSYRTGFNPMSEVDFFQRLMDEKERRSPSYIEIMLSSHPPTQRRIDRQMQTAELSPNNPDALAKIGQGYMRRARYATALEYFQRVATLTPSAPHIQVAMADALAACGGNEPAMTKYQAIMASQQDNAYAQQRLALVQGQPPVVVAALTPAEASQARDHLQEAHLVVLSASTAAIEAEAFAAQLSSRVKPIADLNSRMSNELMGLADKHRELDASVQTAVLAANAAIGKAAEVVYSLEALAPMVSATASGLNEVAEQLEVKLKQLAAGEGEAGQLAVVERSAAEIEAAVGELEQARSEALALASTADHIQWLAHDNLTAMKNLLGRDEEDEDHVSLCMQLRHLATGTQEQAERALDACRRCRRPVKRAELRRLIVQGNLAGMAAPPTQRAALDKLVAHYMRAASADVALLRKEGLGYGDGAYLMAVAVSGRVPASKLMPEVVSGSSMVDQLEHSSASSYGPRIMMKFLVHAMEDEVYALSQLDL